MTAATKRSAASASSSSKRAKTVAASEPRSPSPMATPMTVSRLSDSHPEWPAPPTKLREATEFLEACAASPASDRILLLPDKDADGLCSGAIMYRTLVHALGISPARIDVHLMTKGAHPGASAQRQAIAHYGAKWIIVLDQGSRTGPAIVPGAEHGWRSKRPDVVATMVVDHHFLALGQGGPEGCLMLNACHHEPVATASLLTWVLCRPLWSADADAEAQIDYLAVLGTMGDLSVNVSWQPPFPDLTPEVKKWTKKRLGSAIALLNAPRRTPEFDVSTAWSALLASTSPLTILDPATNEHAARLYAAREAVLLETERCTHTPPKFTKDGRIALLRITSSFQVHPSIATRWTGALKSNKLQAVMCANDGYTDANVHFSCRIANAAKTRGEHVDIIQLLHEYARRDESWLNELMQELGGNAFNGHPQASGGILPTHHFERFTELMQIGVPPDTKRSPAKKPAQKNTLLAMGFSTSPKKSTP
ncbi:single-stranded-DNA-specific exonuclease [Moesziomyces antarcticus]|uniref:Uncharacterized protein n=2 Tax=Pseudozyma antarctica TaxID=84753 RepID=A0A5C3FUW7_PSEA2|nr:single-stranded-DNA-specific exonuclease [Moesziomyces antarcticus]GAK66939.1 single-stranded-DNA-specific exonuclease [Moesziomyces antarcticus]SPO47990.1 uncharacterized protein PSANT_05678 [Moesziomyces antarcticus]